MLLLSEEEDEGEGYAGFFVVLFLGLNARYVPAGPVSYEIRAQRFCKMGGMANWVKSLGYKSKSNYLQWTKLYFDFFLRKTKLYLAAPFVSWWLFCFWV